MSVRSWLGMLLLASSLAAFGCAGTERAEGDDAPVGDDDDDTPPIVDASPFVDAPPIAFPDAAPHSGPADAAPPQPGPPDAAPPNGITCTADNQCDTAAHECCWLLLPPNGFCTYGDVIPILGCFPGDPPDAGP
jgi:hypothetical protein